MKTIAALALIPLAGLALAAEPVVSSWLFNCTGTTGYNGILANVQSVDYDADSTYVQGTGIPSYSIGPWPGNPSTASEQSRVFKIPRSPQPATNHVDTPLGPIGVFTNGVAMFNARDARSYQNQNVWNQNAVVAEAMGFDNCLGHPQLTGMYHHHQVPVCLRAELGDNGIDHSPILGWALDGYPIYGPYGYSDPFDASSTVVRLDSSYEARNITQRRTLPSGTGLPANQWGPNVSGQFPLGLYVEDFVYSAGLGDLDEYNGRFTVTPDYPGGTFAYFATIDSVGDSTYPYLVGPQYYGVPETENFGMGNPTVPVGAATYDGCDPCTTPVSYCPSAPNSTGSGGLMGMSGSASVSAADLVLVTFQLPPGKAGLYIFGPNQAQNPFGNGSVCLGPPILRSKTVSMVQANGSVSQAFDYGNLPAAAGTITAGSSLNFQFWFRDPAGGGAFFNLSDGMCVTFCP